MTATKDAKAKKDGVKKRPCSVLVIDDEDTLRDSMLLVLNEESYRAVGARTVAEGRQLLASDSWDLVITDLRLPDGTGLDIAREAMAVSRESLVLVMTAYANLETALEALRLGASEYMLKPIDFDSLLRKIGQLLDCRRLTQENSALRRAYSVGQESCGFLGESPAAEEVRRFISLYGSTDRAVLITGESGTGKELVARGLHEASPDRTGPFVPVNCAAIPEPLLESELFGHLRGAFTGADRNHHGYFEVAMNGTLFLDEIAELPQNTQAKLLRALESGEVRPLGAERSVSVNTRIVAATNQNLEELIEEGKFRPDLYYRLNVLRVTTPALRDRVEDIPSLAQYFVEKHRRELRTPVQGLTSETLRALRSYSWPGNARELENLVQRALIVGTDEWLEPETFPVEVVGCRDTGSSPCIEESEDGRAVAKLKAAVREFERQFILEELERSGQDKATAAKGLGISLASLYAKLKP